MDWLRRIMAGRYGTDQLTLALLAVYAIFYFTAQITRLYFLVWIALLIFVLCFYRMFSRDLSRRYRENQAFLKFWYPIGNWFRNLSRSVKDRRTHRYYKCPKCSSKLRVPRGRGKIQITCPVCKTEFIKKT